MQAGEFVAFRVPSQEYRSQPRKPAGSSDDPNKPPPRTKRYTLRSKNGCLTCRRRRVRCDEKRPPPCQNCERAQVSCAYALPAALSSAPSASVNPPIQISRSFPLQTPSGPFVESRHLMDLQFWTAIGGPDMGRWHCPLFYDRLLLQFSWLHESVKFSLLALSTCVRQWHVATDEERQSLLGRGAQYYSKACQELLGPADNSRASIEAALVASLALFSYDSFTDHMQRRYIHSNATLSLLRLLKEGLTWNEVSGWRSQFGRAGAQVVIETADLFLNDISYPLFAASRGSTVDMLDASAPGRSRLYNPMWLKLDPSNAMQPSEVADIASMTTIEPPSQSWVLVEVAPTSVQGCDAHMIAWHCWMLTWLITIANSPTELREFQRMTRKWHAWLFTGAHPDTVQRRVMQNRATILDRLFDARITECSEPAPEGTGIEYDLDDMLRLVSENIYLSEEVHNARIQHADTRANLSVIANIRGLAKVVEYVIRVTGNATTRHKALDLISLKPWHLAGT